MFIGAVDKETTLKLQKQLKRKQPLVQCNEARAAELESSTDSESVKSNHDSSDDQFENFRVGLSSDEEQTATQNRNNYPELCKAVDRCKLSNRDACLIVNAVLKDLNMMTSSTALDPSKLRHTSKTFTERTF